MAGLKVSHFFDMARRSLKNVSRLLEIREERIPVEQEFLGDFKRGIELENSEVRVASQTFKPSSMHCKRNSYYQLMGVMPDYREFPYNSVGIVNSGSDIHERTQGYISKFSKFGIDCDWIDVSDFVAERKLEDIVVREKLGMETKLYNKRYNISFMCDGIIKYKGKYYILEIKTEMSSKWYSRDAVDPSHYHQAICYSLSLQLDNVLFLYISRDMLEAKSFLFRVSDDMRKEIIDYIASVNGYVERQVAPPKDKDTGRNICTYCNYRQTCRRDK